MPDTFDRMLSIGATFDWISPLSTLIQNMTNGPRHQFYLDLYAGLSVNNVKGLLKRHGVKVWGDIIIDDVMVVTVRKSQAEWAQYLLEREGVPLLGGQVNGKMVAVPRSEPVTTTPARNSDDGLSRIDRWLEDLLC